MMRPLYIASFVLIAVLISAGCCSNNNKPESNTDTVTFNEKLAKEYGADKYGMKKYVMAFLKRGPNRDRDSVESANLQRAHLKNIGRLAEEGKLVLAGPFFGDDDLRGIYIFNVETIAEAEALTNTDPAIQAGSLVMELREWYGSAALMGVNNTHKTLSNANISQ
jgi:uncharacterized protein YciI